MSETEVRIARESERSSVVASIVAGCVADPVSRWCWPKAETYLTSFPKFVNAYGGRAFEHECAWTEDAHLGGALWLPPGISPDENALGEVMTSTVAEEKHENLFSALEELANYHPDEPHWFLPLIAVDLAWQGLGIGSKLMKHAVARCDDAGERAYLESSNPRNISLYVRYGFQVIGEVRHGDCPVFTAMLREPKS